MTKSSASSAGTAIVADLATPIAKSLARVSRSAAGRERFDSSLLAVEVLLKYAGCVALAGFKPLHRDNCYTIEYGLSRDAALGSWLQHLRQTVDKIRRLGKTTDIPEWLWKGAHWLESKQRLGRESWFTDASQAASEVHKLLKRDGDPSQFRFARVIELFEFLIHLRNKTRGHGAKAESFFLVCDPHLVQITRTLATHFSWFRIELLSRIPGSFRDCLVLRGATPTERTVMEGHAGLDPDRSIVIRPASGRSADLPPLMEYRVDEDKCLFANDGFQLGTRRMEFIDYFSGGVEHVVVPYAVEPVQQNRIGDVCEFPKTDVTDVTAGFVQVHRSQVIKRVRDHVEAAWWSRIALTEANRGRLPSKGGVYCLISHAEAAGLEAHKVVGYVGRTDDLCARFEDYLEEKQANRRRPSVGHFVSEFPGVRFWYTMIDSPESRRRLEDWLIKAIDPPVNERLRLKRTEKENGRE